MKHKYSIRDFPFNCYLYMLASFKLKYPFEKRLKNEYPFITEFLLFFFLICSSKYLENCYSQILKQSRKKCLEILIR